MRICEISSNIYAMPPVPTRHPPQRIALLMSDRDDYWRQFMRGIHLYARSGRTWVLHRTNMSVDGARLVAEWRPAGIIASGIDDRCRAILDCCGCPYVCGTPLSDDLCPSVCMNVDGMAELAVDHLLERGVDRIASFAPNRQPLDRHWERTVHAHCHTRDVEPIVFRWDCEPPRVWSMFDQFLCDWVQRLPKPIGIATPRDVDARLLLEICFLAGIDVPDEVAVIGAGNEELPCDMAHPTLSSVALPIEKAGHEAAAMLDALIQHAQPPVEPLVFEPVGVVPRQSTNIELRADPEIAAMLRFIREHAHATISVEDVMESASISRRTAETRFRALLGRSPLQEIRRVRIERAKQLLADSDLSLSDIATGCGFASAASFGTLFRKAVGVSPGAYRLQRRAGGGGGDGRSHKAASRPQ